MGMCRECIFSFDASDWYWSDVEGNVIWWSGYECMVDKCLRPPNGGCGNCVKHTSRTKDGVFAKIVPGKAVLECRWK